MTAAEVPSDGQLGNPVILIPLIAAAISAAGSIYSSRESRKSAEELQEREHSFQLELQQRAALTLKNAGDSDSASLKNTLVLGTLIAAVPALFILGLRATRVPA